MVLADNNTGKHYWISCDEDEEIKTENGPMVINFYSTPGLLVRKSDSGATVRCIITNYEYDLDNEDMDEVDPICLSKCTNRNLIFN